MDASDPRPPVVVHPIQEGARRVVVYGEPVGKARGIVDLLEFLRRAGLEDPDIEDPSLIEWRGGGSGVWP